MRSGPSSCPMHRSAWKGYSPKFGGSRVLKGWSHELGTGPRLAKLGGACRKEVEFGEASTADDCYATALL